MDTYSFISENGNIREIADLAARTKNTEQDLQINEVTLKTNRLAGYSESETDIGKWTDGKTIYRKVVFTPAAVVVASDAYRSIGVSYPQDAETCFTPRVVSQYDNLFYYNSYKPVQAASLVGITLPAGTAVVLEYTKG